MILEGLILLLSSAIVFADLGIDIELKSSGSYANSRVPWGQKPPIPVSWIKINGKELSVKPGLNIVVVNHATGKIESTNVFDPRTRDHKKALKVLRDQAALIENTKDKRIILGVAHLYYWLDAACLKALKGVVDHDLQEEFIHSSMAFVGYRDSITSLSSFERARKSWYDSVEIRTTIAKLKYGSDMYFALKSQGYIDRRGQPYKSLKSWIVYRKKTFFGGLGINFIVVKHKTGEEVAKKNFNTHSDAKQASAALEYLKSIPEGMLILGVVHSDWIKNAGSALITFLEKIIFTKVPKVFDGSWAFVGYSGGPAALPGSDAPLSRHTVHTFQKRSFRHPIEIHYFTSFSDNECTDGRATCGKNMVCRNTVESYECLCKKGFQRRGEECVDVDECSTRANICGIRATCKNTPGSYVCECKDTRDKMKMGFFCRELKITVSGPDCVPQASGKPPLCTMIPNKIEVNDKNVFENPRRGLLLVLLHSNTGIIDRAISFDMQFLSAPWQILDNIFKSFPKFRIIIGVVSNEHIGRMRRHFNKIKSFTGVAVPEKFHGTFGFIGFTGPGVPPWVMSGTTKLRGGPLIIETRLWLYPSPPYIALDITSVGSAAKGHIKAHLKVGNMDFQKYLKNGFNIGVLSDVSGSIESIKNFGTHVRNSPDIRKMVSFLNSLPNDRIVVGVAKGEAFKGIQHNPQVYKAMERLLAAPVKFKSIGTSYAFIGSTYTGSNLKQFYLQQSAVKPRRGEAKLSSLLAFSSRLKALKVEMISTGCDDPGPHKSVDSERPYTQPPPPCHLAKCSIKIDGEEMALNRKGFNLVAVSLVTGNILNRKVFDTMRSPHETVAMTEFISSLPASAIVFGVVKDTARNFKIDKAKKIMKDLLGHEPPEFGPKTAYTFIGYRGTKKESWVQQKHTGVGKGGIKLIQQIPLRPEMKVELLSQSCFDQHIPSCYQTPNSLKVNGKEYANDKTWHEGFTLLVFNLENGDIEEKKRFHTKCCYKESDKMEAFVKKLPKNRVVLGVIKSDGLTHLRQSAKNAIAGLIHKTSINLHETYASYAFVGYTSKTHYLWIQEAGKNRKFGPTRLSVNIPLRQQGCVFPATPAKGKLQRVEYDATQEAEYNCGKDRVLKGKPQICNSNGSWTGRAPTCTKVEIQDDWNWWPSSSPRSSIQFNSLIFASMWMTFLLSNSWIFNV